MTDSVYAIPRELRKQGLDEEVLSGAVDVCRPMLEKKHNRLESDSGEGITLWGNTEMLLQVQSVSCA